MIFVNKYPEDKEWTAHINLLNQYTEPSRQLRHILIYNNAGPHYPTHIHQDLIEQWVEHERESEFNSTMSIVRHQLKTEGKDINSKAVWQTRKQWRNLAELNRIRKIEGVSNA